MMSIRQGETIEVMAHARNVIGHTLGRVEIIKVREVEPSITPGWVLVFGERLSRRGQALKGRPLLRVELAGNDYRKWSV